jgi:hypothetical protein
MTLDVLNISVYTQFVFVSNKTNNLLIDWLLSVLRPTQEYFTYMETSQMPVRGSTILAYARRSVSLSMGDLYRVIVFPVSSEGPPHSFASYDTQGDVKDLFLPGSSRVVTKNDISWKRTICSGKTFSYTLSNRVYHVYSPLHIKPITRDITTK